MASNHKALAELDVIAMGIKHGDPIECPTCGAPGRINLKTPSGESPEFEISIWYNYHTLRWECSEYWLK